MNKKIFFLFLLIVFASGCVDNIPEKESVKNKAIEECITECTRRLELGINLTKGPCLSDEDVNWMIEDWVCDIAHSPRMEIDNVEENQCRVYLKGNADHFVEVSPECKLIRAI